MLPLVSTIYTPVTPQPSLIATPVPENNTLRVPPTTVAPPVSNAQVDANASGKNPLPLQTVVMPSSPAVTSTMSPVGSIANLSPETPLGAPTTLLAQMIGQNLPPEAQTALRGVLNEYEKIVINSYVKYMPSNASLPRSEPSGAFSQLVKQSAVPVQEKSAPAKNNAPMNTEQASGDADTQEEQPIQATAPAAPKPSYNALNAYAVAAARLPQKPAADNTSVEEVDAAGE